MQTNLSNAGASIRDREIYHATWNVLHLAARTLEPSRNLAFICVILGIRDLFPLQIVRQSLKEFLTLSPLQADCSALSNAILAFDWTYRLHKYCNFIRSKRCGGKPIIHPTLDEAYSRYEASLFPNNGWGPSFWLLWHYMAANLPQQLSANEQLAYCAMVKGLAYVLPCGKCRDHMQQYLQTHDVAASNTKEFHWHFAFVFHNTVNQRLGKPIMTMQQGVNRRQYLTVERDAFNGEILCPI